MTRTTLLYSAHRPHDERVHVIPLDDLRDHEPTAECWCHPTPDEEEMDVWVHHALNQRESVETGRRMIQ